MSVMKEKQTHSQKDKITQSSHFPELMASLATIVSGVGVFIRRYNTLISNMAQNQSIPIEGKENLIKAELDKLPENLKERTKLLQVAKKFPEKFNYKTLDINEKTNLIVFAGVASIFAGALVYISSKVLTSSGPDEETYHFRDKAMREKQNANHQENAQAPTR